MATVTQRLGDKNLLPRIVLNDAVRALLDAMQVPGGRDGDPEQGSDLTFAAGARPLGVLDLNLVPPAGQLNYVLSYEGDAAKTGFRVAVQLSDEAQLRPLFTLLEKAPGLGLKAAEHHADDDQEWLEPAADTTVRLAGAGVVLVVKGRVGEEATVTLSPGLAPPDGLLVLSLQPSTTLLPGGTFGLELAQGVAFDDTTDAAPPGRTVVDGQLVDTAADQPAWRGIAARQARLYLPKGVPFLGGHAVDAYVEVGISPSPGLDMAVSTRVPPHDGRPGIDVLIECRDPTASGLAGFVPTLVELAMELPLDGRRESFDAGDPRTITFAAGRPVIARARFARDLLASGDPPSAPVVRLSLALEAQGPQGILSISSENGGTGARAAVAAAALVTALVADQNLARPGPDPDVVGVWLHVLLTAAVGLSSFLKDQGGHVVLHGVTLEGEGQAFPAQTFRLKLDYSVDAVVDTFNVGVLSLGMSPNQPLRVRVREVELTIDPSKSGLEMFQLGVSKALLEVEDPGGWFVHSPGSLLDILGTRSGRGSTWFEVDLRFKLDLGPVEVSGATVRATIGPDGRVTASLRGLAASLNLRPMIDGAGAIQLLPSAPDQPPGLSVELAAHIQPLDGLGADATFLSRGDMLKLSLGVDLPGAIPLFNTGLGVYAIGGVFAHNGHPTPPPPNADPVQYQLDWDYRDAAAWSPASGAAAFGLELVIGTAPDLGFTFSSRAGVVVTTPDAAVRGALAARLFAPRATLARDGGGGVVTAQGVLVVDPGVGVTVGLRARYVVPPAGFTLVSLEVPIGSRFPKNAPDWYIHLGADGPPVPPGQGRDAGPVRATILPELFSQHADAYLMFRGNGIQQWPRGGQISVTGSFLIAFGFGFQLTMGLEGVIWAEVHAQADILMATHPLMVVGSGQIGGGLHLGPVSIGVDAALTFSFVDGQDPRIEASVCGHVDLFFFSISGCAHIAIGADPTLAVPPPTEHPLDRVDAGEPGPTAYLIDDYYRRIPLSPGADGIPVVWPDAIVHFQFATAPTLPALPDPANPRIPPDALKQFPGAAVYPEGVKRAKPVGTSLLSYDWQLTSLQLLDVTNGGPGTPFPGTLSAAWLTGKSGDAGGQAQPAELVLNTPDRNLWLWRLGHGGTGLTQDPLADEANLCQFQATAAEGWTLGVMAEAVAVAYRLPPEVISADPLSSQVQGQASLTVTALGGPLEAYGAQRLASGLTFVPGGIVSFAAPVALERAFTGFLEISRVSGLPGQDIMRHNQDLHELDIDLADGVIGGRLWLVTDGAEAVDHQRLFVRDDRARSWSVADRREIEGGLFGFRFVPPALDPVHRIVVSWRVGSRLGVLGLGGITQSAAAGAAARNQAAAAVSDRQKEAAGKGPPSPGQPTDDARRSVLDPGRLYRVDVGMTWSGTLSTSSDTGPQQVAHLEDQTTYAPTAPGVSNSTSRSFYFRTAPLGRPPEQELLWATTSRFDLLYHKQDLFDPAMLERHLLGYEPAQSELTRFRDDPLNAHFAVSHVAALADRYGFVLLLGLRRVDVPASPASDRQLAAVWSPLTSASLATGLDKRRIDLAAASPCTLPGPGATLSAPPDTLAPEAWYEVYVLARAKGAEVLDGKLPGVTFRTSRWQGSTDMLQELRFPTDGQGLPDGDTEIAASPALGPATVTDSDAAFDAALDALGLEGWPASAGARVSVLWSRAAGPTWLCAGVLVESPEPVHRPGRVEVKALKLNMGLVVGAGVTFDLCRRDRAGNRHLFLTSTPFLPRVWVLPGVLEMQQPALILEVQDFKTGGPAGGIELEGSLTLPLQPAFAQETP
jgi:hypothetical protein